MSERARGGDIGINDVEVVVLEHARDHLRGDVRALPVRHKLVPHQFEHRGAVLGSIDLEKKLATASQMPYQ